MLVESMKWCLIGCGLGERWIGDDGRNGGEGVNGVIDGVGKGRYKSVYVSGEVKGGMRID